MSIYKGTTLLAGVATNTKYNANDLLDWKWTDHELTDQSWLKAGTFSWQDGTVYSDAYNHLVDDYNSSQATSYYAWTYDNSYTYYTLSETPSAYDQLYEYSGGSMVEADPLEELREYDSTTVPPRIRVVNDGGGGSAYYDRNVEEDISVKTPSSETIGSYTITYYLALDGHKIILSDMETTASNIYNESGVAWYYVLDTANTRFKLPRENPAREELISLIQAPVKGNGKTLGLYDGSTNAGVRTNASDQLVGSSSAYNTSVGTSNTSTWSGASSKTIGITTDATKSGIVADLSNSTSTSIYKGKKYLYFYVGQFSQSATEQTAGLNAGLFNGKVDLDSSWGFPTETYDDLTLGASDTYYTAPADGYFVLSKASSATNQYMNMYIVPSNATTRILGATHMSTASGVTMASSLPARKGQRCFLTYTVGGTTNYFRFIYAQKTN